MTKITFEEFFSYARDITKDKKIKVTSNVYEVDGCKITVNKEWYFYCKSIFCNPMRYNVVFAAENIFSIIHKRIEFSSYFKHNIDIHVDGRSFIVKLNATLKSQAQMISFHINDSNICHEKKFIHRHAFGV